MNDNHLSPFPDVRFAGSVRFTLRLGALHTFGADAVFCAAPPDLTPAGAMRHALLQAAGEGPYEECRFYAGIKQMSPGTALLTAAGRLQARHLLHLVLPDWQAGSAEALRRYTAALRVAFALAHKHSARSIVMPLLGTELNSWPAEHAMSAMLEAVFTALELHPAAFDSFTWALRDSSEQAAARAVFAQLDRS